MTKLSDYIKKNSCRAENVGYVHIERIEGIVRAMRNFEDNNMPIYFFPVMNRELQAAEDMKIIEHEFYSVGHNHKLSHYKLTELGRKLTNEKKKKS